MSTNEGLSRKTYLSQNVGNYPETTTIFGREYKKVNDLRYGTNPHQTAGYYKPLDKECSIGDLKILKTGKDGLSQTNLEDISYTLNICKYFHKACCACMKHVNPCGFALASEGENVKEVYTKARDCDPRAAFGSVVGFNCEVNEIAATEIMSTFVECVVAPSVTKGALEIFKDHKTFGLNKHIRIIQCGDLARLPKFRGDINANEYTIKVLADGSLIVAEPLLTQLRTTQDLSKASAENKKDGFVESMINVTSQQLLDLLTAWYLNLSVRSNGVVVVKNGEALAVGTGEQDRVGAVEQAIWKYKNKYKGHQNIKDSVMASDGFFPFYDAVEIAAEAGVSVMISPAGSLRDAEVIKRANELGVALFHAPERIFSHH